MLFETVTGTKIVCTQGGAGSGTVASAAGVGGVSLLLHGCQTSGGQCNSPGLLAGEVVLPDLEGVLGVERTGLTPATDKLALELHPAEGKTFTTLACGAFLIEVHGSVLLPTPAGTMRTMATERLAEKAGEQKPDRFAGGVEDEHALEWSISGGPVEEVGLATNPRTKGVPAGIVVTYEEPIEANPVA